MATAAIVGSSLAAASAIGTGVTQAIAANKQSEAQKKARDIEQRRAAVENARQVRRTIAAQRIKQAQIEAQGVAQGIQNSSAVGGAAGSLASDTSSNIGSLFSQVGARQGAQDALIGGLEAQQKASAIGGILQGFGAAASAGAKFGAANPDFSLFGSNSTSTPSFVSTPSVRKKVPTLDIARIQ